MIILPKTSYVGRNIKVCLPDRSKIPDLGNNRFSEPSILGKKREKSPVEN